MAEIQTKPVPMCPECGDEMVLRKPRLEEIERMIQYGYTVIIRKQLGVVSVVVTDWTRTQDISSSKQLILANALMDAYAGTPEAQVAGVRRLKAALQ